jgi:BASS family bile acid:Na+ symporter
LASPVVTVVRACAQVAIPLVTFAVGLSAVALRSSAPGRQRGLLGRSLLAMLLVVPAVTIALVKVVPVAPEVRTGLMSVGIAVGPAAALGKSGRAEGDAEYALSLNLTLLLAGLLYVPLAAALVSVAFPRDLAVSARDVLRPVLTVELAPVLAGLGLARLAPRAAARLARPVSRAGNVVLGVVGLMVLALVWRAMLRIGGAGLLVVAAAALAGVVAGHALGGPSRRTRMVLASFAAVRFPAMALVVAAAAQQGRRALPVIAAYLLTSSAALGAYGLLRKVASSARSPRPAPAGA